MDHTRPLTVKPWRIAAALLPGAIAGIIFILRTGPLPQPLSYHDFADNRVLMGIPHAGDVLTNLAFLAAGAWGLWSLAQQKLIMRSFIDGRERTLYQWLFIGVLLTGLGSGWYHLEPDNYSLVWDRLPMTISFMSIFSIMITERIKLTLGIGLLWPLMAIGIASVFLWIWTEYIGQGDMRGYLVIQFYPLLAIASMLLFLPTRYTHGNEFWGLFFLYAAAKFVEVLDHEIFNLTHNLISGHNLKHLFAAASAVWILRMLWLRHPRGLLSASPYT